MVPVKLSKEGRFFPISWHWRLATTYSSLHDRWEYSGDICDYSQHVFKGAFLATVLTAVIAGLAICFLDLFIWIGVGLTMGWVMANPPAVFAMLLAACAISLVAYVFIEDWWVKRKFKMEDLESSEPRAPKKASFIAQVYRRMKDKTCFRLEIS